MAGGLEGVPGRAPQFALRESLEPFRGGRRRVSIDGALVARGEQERSRITRGDVYKGIGAAAVVVGGLSVITVIVLSVLSATGKGPNILDMGKQVNVSVPGTMAQTSVGALVTVGAGILGLGLLATGSVLIHKGRKRSAEEERAARGEQPETRTFKEIKIDAFRAFTKQPTGTNKKWIGGVLGVASAIVGAAVIVLVVVPLFKDIPQVNHMGSMHTAISSSGVHGIVISTGAIVTISLGAGSLLTGVLSAIIFANGVKNARDKEKLQRDYELADQNYERQLRGIIDDVRMMGGVVNHAEDGTPVSIDLTNLVRDSQREAADEAANAEYAVIVARLGRLGIEVTRNINGSLNAVIVTGMKASDDSDWKPTATQALLYTKDVVGKLNAANARLSDIRPQFETAQKRVAELEGQLQANQGSAEQIQKASEELVKARATVVNLRQEVEAANKAKAEADQLLAAANARNSAIEAELLEAKGEVAEFQAIINAGVASNLFKAEATEDGLKLSAPDAVQVPAAAILSATPAATKLQVAADDAKRNNLRKSA